MVFKRLLSILAVGCIVAFSSCKKDDDDDGSNGGGGGQAAVNELEQALDGRYNVEAIDFDGTVTSLGFTLPLDSAGNGGSGYYDFDATDKTVYYDVLANIKFTVLTEEIVMPIPISGLGDFEVLSTTRFTISDGSNQTLICDLIDVDENSLSFKTSITIDTLDALVDTDMDIYLSREE